MSNETNKLCELLDRESLKNNHNKIYTGHGEFKWWKYGEADLDDYFATGDFQEKLEHWWKSLTYQEQREILQEQQDRLNGELAEVRKQADELEKKMWPIDNAIRLLSPTHMVFITSIKDTKVFAKWLKTRLKFTNGDIRRRLNEPTSHHPILGQFPEDETPAILKELNEIGVTYTTQYLKRF